VTPRVANLPVHEANSFVQSVPDEAMLASIVTAVRGRVYLTTGCPVQRAEQYVLVAVANAAKTRSLAQARRRSPLIPRRALASPGSIAPTLTMEERERATMRLDPRNRVARSKRRAEL
jgi:hypothetical protein